MKQSTEVLNKLGRFLTSELGKEIYCKKSQGCGADVAVRESQGYYSNEQETQLRLMPRNPC